MLNTVDIDTELTFHLFHNELSADKRWLVFMYFCMHNITCKALNLSLPFWETISHSLDSPDKFRKSSRRSRSPSRHDWKLCSTASFSLFSILRTHAKMAVLWSSIFWRVSFFFFWFSREICWTSCRVCSNFGRVFSRTFCVFEYRSALLSSAMSLTLHQSCNLCFWRTQSVHTNWSHVRQYRLRISSSWSEHMPVRVWATVWTGETSVLTDKLLVFTDLVSAAGPLLRDLDILHT